MYTIVSTAIQIPMPILPNIHYIHSLQEKNIVPFKRLPLEIYFKIFSYLDPLSIARASLVNRSWYQIANDPAFSQRVQPVRDNIVQTNRARNEYCHIPKSRDMGTYVPVVVGTGLFSVSFLGLVSIATGNLLSIETYVVIPLLGIISITLLVYAYKSYYRKRRIKELELGYLQDDSYFKIPEAFQLAIKQLEKEEYNNDPYL